MGWVMGYAGAGAKGGNRVTLLRDANGDGTITRDEVKAECSDDIGNFERQHAFALAHRLPVDDVVLTMIQDGDHRLSRPQDIARLIAAVEEL